MGSEMCIRDRPYVDIKTPIVPAKLRNQAGIVGAAYYASTKQQ